MEQVRLSCAQYHCFLVGRHFTNDHPPEIKSTRYKYELEQGEKTKKAKSTVVETKEVKLTPKTDDNDVSIKLKSTQKFLDKVRSNSNMLTVV